MGTKQRFCKGPSTKRSPGGFVLVFVAFIIIALVGIAVLVCDSLLSLSSHEQLRHTCEYAALSALKIYRESEPGNALVDPHEFALDQVRQRVNQLVTYNMMISPHVDQARPPFRDFGVDRSSLPGAGRPDTFRRPGGLLTPGRWLRGGNQLCAGQDPCFISTTNADIAAVPRRLPNAFRCEGSLSSPIRTMLGHIIGTDTLTIQADAIAADAPRDVFMALDLSLSLASVNHVDENPLPNPEILCPDNMNSTLPVVHPGFASEFAWYYPRILREANDITGLYLYKFMSLQVTGNTPLVGQGSGPYLGQICGQVRNWRTVSDLSPMDQARLLKPFQRPGPSIPTLHFMSDYEFVEFRSPGALPNPNCDAWYTDLMTKVPAGITIPRHTVLNERAEAFGTFDERCTYVDLFQDPPQYMGPEPFSSLTRGVDAAIQTLAAFGSQGDRIGLVPFDQAVFPFPSQQDARPPLRSLPLSDPQDAWNFIHPNPDPHPQLNDYIQIGIFPRFLNTNVSLGIRNALAQFDQSESPGKKLIVLFTDGLANCLANQGNNCLNTDQNHLDAFNELRGPFVSSLQNDGVELAVIMVPESRSFVFTDIQPRAHTFNIQREEYEECCKSNGANPRQISHCSPSCSDIVRWMSDKEAMAAELEFVESRSSSFMPEYLGPHKLMWDLARGSGGRYFVMRPQPPPQSCSAQTGETDCADRDPNDPQNCIPRSPFLESDGRPQRQFFDPFCRDLAQQVQESLDDILNDPTLRLVQ